MHGKGPSEMSFTVSADTRLLQARLLDVSKGVKGGLRKAIGDSTARIGVQLARDTFPLSEKGAKARKEAQVRRVYPTPGRIYEILKDWAGGVNGYRGTEDFQRFKVRLAKLFLNACKEGRMGDALAILNAFPPFRATTASSANEATFRSFAKQRTGAGDLNKQGLPKVFWNCILLPPSGDSSRGSQLQAKQQVRLYRQRMGCRKSLLPRRPFHRLPPQVQDPPPKDRHRARQLGRFR